jgi:hypothetical protein
MGKIDKLDYFITNMDHDKFNNFFNKYRQFVGVNGL